MTLLGNDVSDTGGARLSNSADLLIDKREPRPLMRVSAILSMLHEPFGRLDSASRRFRGQPVLRRTLQRLAHASRIKTISVLCWEDQKSAVQPIVEECCAYVLPKGPRGTLPPVEAVATAGKWSDGWRGGLLSTCSFDRGFHAPWMLEIAQQLECEAILLVDPAAGLIDPNLLDATILHADGYPKQGFFFMPAAPGLSAPLLRIGLLQQIASQNTHIGRYLHYLPASPMPDPLGGDACVSVAASLARTAHRFMLDSDRQIASMERHALPLNPHCGDDAAGHLGSTELMVERFSRDETVYRSPRDVSLEINVERHSTPIFLPSQKISRSPLPPARWQSLFQELGQIDDLRLTLSGIGDPLASDYFLEIVHLARAAGINAIHVETDLLRLETAQLQALASSPIDILSVHIPATSSATYRSVMGIDGLLEVVENLKNLLTHRQAGRGGVPIIVPKFVKCRQNLAEMEAWYDQWLTALGSAVIAGPSHFAAHDDCAVADMSPTRRVPCHRLQRRMHILCNGAMVACEQDIHGHHPIGQVGQTRLADAWSVNLNPLRQAHRNGQWNQHSLCAGCREWHRP